MCFSRKHTSYSVQIPALTLSLYFSFIIALANETTASMKGETLRTCMAFILAL